MKCEGCRVETTGYNLHDYCEVCGKNMCSECMANKKCRESGTGKHVPAHHGGDSCDGD
jgi:hypothetical protein